MPTQILRLNKAGHAMEWIGLEAAACLYTKEQVLWTYGENAFELKGGMSRHTGLQSRLKIASVIATEGTIHVKSRLVPRLNNIALFRRDNFICLYCGKLFSRTELTCDHVMPRARGGKDSWVNCVTACRSCNNHKACRTPEEAGMELLAIPFKPNKSEYLALENRNILADQMAFLEKGFSKNMLRYN